EQWCVDADTGRVSLGNHVPVLHNHDRLGSPIWRRLRFREGVIESSLQSGIGRFGHRWPGNVCPPRCGAARLQLSHIGLEQIWLGAVEHDLAAVSVYATG